MRSKIIIQQGLTQKQMERWSMTLIS